MFEDIDDYLVAQHDYSKEYEENCKKMQEHKDDMLYKKNMVQDIMTDIAFCECIKSLTHSEKN